MNFFPFKYILNLIYFCDVKAEFSAVTTQSSMSLAPSEIILICWFDAQETFPIINIENSCCLTFLWKPGCSCSPEVFDKLKVQKTSIYFKQSLLSLLINILRRVWCNKSSKFCKQTIVGPEFIIIHIRKGKPSLRCLGWIIPLDLKFSTAPWVFVSSTAKKERKRKKQWHLLIKLHWMPLLWHSVFDDWQRRPKELNGRDKTDQISNSRHSLKQHKGVF